MTRAKGPFHIESYRIPTGFRFGSAKVEGFISRPQDGYVCVGITTPKGQVSIYASRTGKLRVFDATGEVKITPRRPK